MMCGMESHGIQEHGLGGEVTGGLVIMDYYVTRDGDWRLEIGDWRFDER